MESLLVAVVAKSRESSFPPRGVSIGPSSIEQFSGVSVAFDAVSAALLYKLEGINVFQWGSSATPYNIGGRIGRVDEDGRAHEDVRVLQRIRGEHKVLHIDFAAGRDR